VSWRRGGDRIRLKSRRVQVRPGCEEYMKIIGMLLLILTYYALIANDTKGKTSGAQNILKNKKKKKN
jgi:hypothetical protein